MLSRAIFVFGETHSEVTKNYRLAQAAPKMFDLLRRMAAQIVDCSTLETVDDLIYELENTENLK